ncbi:MAG: 50S ribosomal protein L32 [Cytophagales bacterium]|nr:MAG: 50S ribosomal protein L32 [Cytophagales bacterium]TAF60303.1 MAG: 50S ribosomal protein L32 [Cytophagales bacterium]
MPNPKRKISRTRRDKRRTHHVLEPAAIVDCPNCGSTMRYHHVCGDCGHYRGKQVLEVATA